MTVRNLIKALLAFVLVSLSSYFLEVRLHREGIPSYDLIVFSNLTVGLIAAALVYVMSLRERQREEYVECRLKVIADMNHHIRNALQVISYYGRKGDKPEARIIEAVERIQWALREVLPQLPDSPGSSPESDRVVMITAAPRAQSRR